MVTLMIERALQAMYSSWETLLSPGCQGSNPIVTLSTCEAEYIVASWCACHAIWMRRLLSKMESKQEAAIMIRVDNRSAIELEKNPVNHERSKHIDVWFHFIREHVKDGSIELKHVASKDQATNILTKPLSKELFDRGKKMLGMMNRRNIWIYGGVLLIKFKPVLGKSKVRFSWAVGKFIPLKT